MALPFRTPGRALTPATAAAHQPVAAVEPERGSPGARSIAGSWQPPLARPPRHHAGGATTDSGNLPETRRCEAAFLDDLQALLAALRLPLDALPERPVSVAALGGALAELERADRSEAHPPAAIEARRRRLLALSGASAKLGALLDQRRRGLLPDAALHDRRADILARLAPFFAANEA